MKVKKKCFKYEQQFLFTLFEIVLVTKLNQKPNVALTLKINKCSSEDI